MPANRHLAALPARLALLALLALPGVPASAQEPLSAIDWLSDSIRTPALPEPTQPEVAETAVHDEVEVTPIGGTRADATGLLPPEITGLSPDLWQGSRALDVAMRLRQDRSDHLPAMQDLFRLLLLAELVPPPDAGTAPVVLLARIDALLELGAVEQAAALVERAGSTSPEVFRREFDIALLLGRQDDACARLRSNPALSPTFTARIYCLARGGDWAGATLALETGRALGFVSDEEDALLARFLELGLEHDESILPLPIRPSPLQFRIHEAIGRPLPTTGLPRAFAHADLGKTKGWKVQIEAAERLARFGAVDGNLLFGLYTAGKPAASGGVWDRAASIVALNGALVAGNASVTGPALVTAWSEMQAARLEVPFAGSFCSRLARVPLTGEAELIRFRVCLLAGRATALPDLADPADRLPAAIAGGAALDGLAHDPISQAVAQGFAATGIPVRLQSLVDENRMGEAILRAIDMFQAGALGDLDELTDALVFLRSTGLEDHARRAAIELLILDRRG